MDRLRIGVIGAGTIAQVEHIPNLRRLADRFELRAVTPDHEALLALPLDAVLVASPDPLHLSHVTDALAAGLHVFCEKPLTYASSDALLLAERRDRAGRVLQTGYMKRFDPSYEALLALLPAQTGRLRMVSVEVTDPDAGPFVRHHDVRLGDDLLPAAAEAVRAERAAQVARAVPAPLDELAFRGFTAAYASSIVHDVNAVHGVLDVLGTTVDGVVGAALFAGGLGGQGAVSLDGGEALWTMSHLTVPGLPHYCERITLTFEGSSLELEFPSPYLDHAPTRLVERRGVGAALHTREIRTGYEEAFVEELKGFHGAVTRGEAVRNTAEDAARDMALLADLAARHSTHGNTRERHPT